MAAVIDFITTQVDGLESWQRASIFMILGCFVAYNVLHTATYTVLTAMDRRMRHNMLKAGPLTPEQLKQWSKRDVDTRRAGLYVNSMIHALITAGWSGYLIWKYGIMTADTALGLKSGDPTAPGPGCVDVESVRVIGSISVAYFAYDFIATAPDWHSHPADFFHHLIGLVMTSSFFFSDRSPRLGPHVFIMESSTVFLNINWFLSYFSGDKHYRSGLVMMLFALLFAVFRQGYLPYITYISWVHLYEDFVAHVPQIGIALVLLTLLNTYWMSKIIKQASSAPKQPIEEAKKTQ